MVDPEIIDRFREITSVEQRTENVHPYSRYPGSNDGVLLLLLLLLLLIGCWLRSIRKRED